MRRMLSKIEYWTGCHCKRACLYKTSCHKTFTFETDVLQKVLGYLPCCRGTVYTISTAYIRSTQLSLRLFLLFPHQKYLRSEEDYRGRISVQFAEQVLLSGNSSYFCTYDYKSGYPLWQRVFQVGRPVAQLQPNLYDRTGYAALPCSMWSEI